MQMISLPGLDGCASQDLRDVTGWNWRWQADVHARHHIKRLFSICCSTGLVSIVGPCGELLMLGLSRSRPDLHIPDAFFDPDLASAAFSAECHNAPSTSTLAGSSPRKQRSPQKAASASEHHAHARMAGLFKGVEKKLRDAANRVRVNLDDRDTHAGEASSGQASPSAARSHCCGASPELRMLLEKGCVVDDDEEEGDGGEWPAAGHHLQHTSSAPPPVSPQKATAGPQMAATAPSPSTASTSASAAARVRPASGKVGTRTAAEIKEAYGYSGRGRAGAAQQRAAGTAAIMSDNVARMHERQERLSRLEERTADMMADAEGFAAAAKRLAQQQSKPWWKPF
jgi:hypothetical protein